MKLKRTNKLLAVLLTLVMLVGLLPMTAMAEEADTIDIVIDLSNYDGTVNGSFSESFWTSNQNSLSAVAGKVNTFSLKSGLADNKRPSGSCYLIDLQYDSYCPWIIEGTTGNGVDIQNYIFDDADNEQIRGF